VYDTKLFSCDLFVFDEAEKRTTYMLATKDKQDITSGTGVQTILVKT
jgi:hypothetical protein